MDVRSRLRWLRGSLGWSQQELAHRVGISRAEVSGIETGRLKPSVAVALALARTFDCRVEEIFTLSEPVDPTPRWVTPPGAGGRFWRAEVGGRDMFYGVEPTAAGSIAHDGLLRDGQFAMRPGTDPTRTLVLAGCDPAVGLLASELARARGVRLLPITRSSRWALELLREGTVHAAGVHLCDHAGRSSNRRTVREILGPGYRLLRLVRWQEGLVFASNLHLGSTTDVKAKSLRWVARDEGSGARSCLDRLLEDQAVALTRDPRVAFDHRGTAEAIRSGWAEAGVCVQLAAEEAGLSFLPVQEEAYDICYAPQLEGDPRLDALLEVVRSLDLRKVLGELPGYDARMAGEVRIA